jgi:hypothetical protein
MLECLGKGFRCIENSTIINISHIDFQNIFFDVRLRSLNGNTSLSSNSPYSDFTHSAEEGFIWSI